MPVFFIQPTNIVDDTVVLSGALFRHIVKSLRIRQGEPLTFNDEQGRRYHTAVQMVTKDLLRSHILRVETNPSAGPSPTLVLGQPILKGEKMSWVIQKATELGVDTIIPLITERVITKIPHGHTDKVLARWHRIGVEAAQQSERWSLPAIMPPQRFDQFLRGTPEDAQKIILAERTAGISLSRLRLPSCPRTTIVVVCGPEGGWAPKEVEDARSAGFSLATLGRGILRAETASLAALAVLQSRLLDHVVGKGELTEE